MKVKRKFLEKDSMIEVHYFGHNLRSKEDMTMNLRAKTRLDMEQP
jgi:hypothetical protein